MSIVLTRADSDHILTSTTPVTAAPLTIVAWFYSTDATLGIQTPISICDSAGDINYFELHLRGNAVGSDPSKIAALSRSVVGTAYSASTASWSASTWHHGAAVYASASSRTVYLDGVAGSEDTTAITPAGIDRMGIGGRVRSTVDSFVQGYLVEIAVWSVALVADEIQALANGVCPLLVRPTGLVAYYPIRTRLDNDEWPDEVGGYDMTEANTPADSALVCPSVSSGPSASILGDVAIVSMAGSSDLQFGSTGVFSPERALVGTSGLTFGAIGDCTVDLGDHEGLLSFERKPRGVWRGVARGVA